MKAFICFFIQLTTISAFFPLGITALVKPVERPAGSNDNHKKMVGSRMFLRQETNYLQSAGVVRTAHMWNSVTVVQLLVLSIKFGTTLSGDQLK